MTRKVAAERQAAYAAKRAAWTEKLLEANTIAHAEASAKLQEEAA